MFLSATKDSCEVILDEWGYSACVQVVAVTRRAIWRCHIIADSIASVYENVL